MAKAKEVGIVSAKARYERMKLRRDSVLRQAREAARLTIPGLIPEEGSSDPHDTTEQPWTSMGARLVNNLAAKNLLSLFPPERPFFRLDIGPDVAASMGAELGEANAALSDISRRAMVIAEESSSRTVWMEALRHLIIAGNVLTYQPDDGGLLRMWRIDQFVVRRASDGGISEAVIRDEVYPSELSDEVRRVCDVKFDPEKGDEVKIEIFTRIHRDAGTIKHYEQINGITVPGSEGSVALESSGWQALRWQAVPGSDYGRAYVTEYAGDFLTLEDAMKSIVKFAIEASRIIRTVDPNSALDIEELASAESGDFIHGLGDRITTLQLDKNQDFQVVWEVAQSIERRLSQAFLIASNAIRNAERVTAEEIRAIAQELEDALGGTYTVLSAEVQRPYARRLLHILARKKEAPKLPDSVNLVIVTGFNALGQNHETAALKMWLEDLLALGPQFIQTNLDGQKVALRLGVGRGITDVLSLLRTPEDIAQEQQNAAATQAGLAATPNLARGLVDSVNAAAPQG